MGNNFRIIDEAGKFAGDWPSKKKAEELILVHDMNAKIVNLKTGETKHYNAEARQQMWTALGYPPESFEEEGEN